MLHFNSIGWAPNGDEYHVYYNARMVFNWTQQKIMAQGGLLHCPHDVLVTNDGFFTCSSTDKALYHFYNNGDIRVVVKNQEVAVPDCPNHAGFTHGIARGDDILFVCSAPTKIQTFKDRHWFNFIEVFHCSGAVNECIYDLTLDPRDWRIPCH